MESNTSKELINLKLKLNLVREEIKQRSKHANANVKGLKRAEKQEQDLINKIRKKESKGEGTSQVVAGTEPPHAHANRSAA